MAVVLRLGLPALTRTSASRGPSRSWVRGRVRNSDPASPHGRSRTRVRILGGESRADFPSIVCKPGRLSSYQLQAGLAFLVSFAHVS